jgi:hypothetical protein
MLNEDGITSQARTQRASIPASSVAFQKAQDRLQKHFEPHLPQGPDAHPARVAVLDYVSNNRASILAGGTRTGAVHHKAVNAQLHENGAENTMTPQAIKTGAKLFEAREQLADRMAFQGSRNNSGTINQSSWPQNVRAFEDNQAQLRSALVPELPKGAAMAAVRYDTIQVIKNNRHSIAQNGAPHGSDLCNAVWRPVTMKMIADPQALKNRTGGASTMASKQPAQGERPNPAREFFAKVESDRQARNNPALSAPSSTPDVTPAYPLIAPEKIQQAAKLFIEREQLSNRALAQSMNGSNILDDPKLVAMDRAAGQASQPGILDNTQSDYANGRILAQSPTSERSTPHVIIPATPSDHSMSAAQSGSRQNGNSSSASADSDIFNDARLRDGGSPGVFSGQPPLTMNTVHTHTTSTTRGNSASEVAKTPDAKSAANSGEHVSQTPEGSAAGASAAERAAQEQMLQDSIGRLSPLASGRPVGLPTGWQGVNTPIVQDTMPQESIRQFSSARHETGSRAGDELGVPPTASPNVANSSRENHGIRRPSSYVSPQLPADRIEDLMQATPSGQTAPAFETPQLEARQLEARQLGSQWLGTSQNFSSSQSSEERGTKRGHSQDSGTTGETSQKRARTGEPVQSAEQISIRSSEIPSVPSSHDAIESFGSQKSGIQKSGSQGFVASQAEEVSEQRISEVSTEKEGSDRSVSSGSQSKESSDSWQSGASSDPDWKPGDGAVARAEQRLEKQAAAVPTAELRLEAREQLDLRMGRTGSARDYQETSQSSQSSGYQASGDTGSSAGSAAVSGTQASSQSQRSTSQSNASQGTPSSRSGLVESQAIEDNRSYKSASTEKPSQYSSVGSDGWRSGLSASDHSYRPNPSQIRRADAGDSSSGSSQSSASSGKTNASRQEPRQTSAAPGRDVSSTRSGRPSVPDRTDERSRSRGRS